MRVSATFSSSAAGSLVGDACVRRPSTCGGSLARGSTRLALWLDASDRLGSAASVSNGSGDVVAVGSARPLGSSKPSASDISSTFGRSLRSFSPKRSRNSRVVPYMNGRPTTCLRPTVLISLRSISVESTPPLLLTPRISAISGAVTGCL